MWKSCETHVKWPKKVRLRVLRVLRVPAGLYRLKSEDLKRLRDLLINVLKER